MKITLYASVSANGRILLAENPHHQVPQKILNDFMYNAIQVGNLILGKKTFDLMLQHPAAKEAFSNVDIVVLSNTHKQLNGYTVVDNPIAAIQYFAAKGVKQIFIGGGTLTYNAFLNIEMVTEIYLNIVPLLSGSGGIIGTNDELITKFKMIDQRLIADDIVQLHLIKI